MNRARRLFALLLAALTLCVCAAAGAEETPAVRTNEAAAVEQKQAAQNLPLAVRRTLSDVRRVSRGTFAQPQLTRERILRFDVTAQVNPDASITVREDLEFIATGLKIKRGLVRAIPVRYQTNEGRKVEVGLKVLSTSVDGRTLSWKESDEGRGRSIRIGDPRHMLTPGTHRLTLIYTMTKMLGFFDTHDELYWNVTGNEWDLPIQSATFRLKLPGMNFGEGFNTVEWYTGRFGSTDTSGARETADHTTVTTRALQPGQGLTVVYTWPKGIVLQPEKSQLERFGDLAWRYGSSIFNWLAGLGVAVGAALLALAGWKGATNHTAEVAPIPLFHAPKDLPPAQARFIHCGETDSKALSAEIIRLAVDGWLKITGSKKEGYTLEKIMRPSGPDDPARKKLLETLFPDGETHLSLKKSQHEKFQAAQKAVKEAADADALYAKKNGALWGAFLAMLIGFGAASAFALVTDSGTAVQFAGGIFAAVVCVPALSAVINGVGSTLGGAFVIGAAFFRFILPVGIWAFATLSDEPRSFWYALPVLLAVLVAVPLRKRMLYWTDTGRKKLEQTKGLEMFITAAEKDRLELLNAPDDTPELFEELLPYAVATDTVKNWTSRFAKVLEAASYQPEWCPMPMHGAHFVASDFTEGFNGLSSGFSSSLSSASTPPGSRSGSSGYGGGGGSSGGGGGGGGGHGW